MVRDPAREPVQGDVYRHLTSEVSARSLNENAVAVPLTTSKIRLTPIERGLHALESSRWIAIGPRAGEGMRYFALFYDVVDDFVENRAPYRGAHLRLVQEAHRRGEIELAGALGMPPDRALLIFRCSEPSIASDFARADPYVVNGLVTHWEVQPWAVVVGNELAEGDPIGIARTDV
jgi:uncharacterized protein YciI